MTDEQKKGNKPTHTAYVVEDFTRKGTGEVDSSWHEVGVSFLHKDGKGFDTVITPGLAVSGRIVHRLNEPKKKGAAGDATAAAPKGSDWQA